MSTTQVATGPNATDEAEAEAVVVPVRAAAGTHIGHKRDHNEDSHLVDVERRLFAVADGLGGRPAGEEASALTVAALDSHVTTATLAGGPECRALVDAIDQANRDVLRHASADEERQGMGSTVVACQITWDGVAVIAHAGDSRAYLLRRGQLARLTHDHVRVERRRRLLTRCVGRGRGAAPDVIELLTEPGDRLLLCTDGLTDMLQEDVISWLLTRNDDQQAAVEALVGAALDAGGRDNITIVLLDLGEPPVPVEGGADDDDVAAG